MRQWPAGFAAIAILAAPAAAATPREMLVQAAFSSRDKAQATTQIAAAIGASDAILQRVPGDKEARLQRALGIGYRALLAKDRTDALTARREFEALAAAYPNDPEILGALGGWHVNAVIQLGSLLARTALGARRAIGLATLARAAQAGREHAAFPAMSALFRIALDPGDVVEARRLAETAAAAPATTPLDRILQRRAAAILPALRDGHGASAAALARTLLPFAAVAR